MRFQELLGSRTIHSDPATLAPDGVTTLTAEGLPDTTLECVCGEGGHRLSWSVPRTGWPEGIRCCELELRRAQDADWQPISTAAGQRLPLRIESLPATPLEGFRTRALWSNVSPRFQVGRLVEEGAELEPDDALGLLTELLPWRHLPCHPAVAKDFEWAGALSSWLCRRMSAVIHREDKTPALRLLHLASGAEGRHFFVDVPGLLALPANLYQSLAGDEPLLQSLIACGRLTASETVAASIVGRAGRVGLQRCARQLREFQLPCFQSSQRRPRIRPMSSGSLTSAVSGRRSGRWTPRAAAPIGTRTLRRSAARTHGGRWNNSRRPTSKPRMTLEWNDQRVCSNAWRVSFIRAPARSKACLTVYTTLGDSKSTRIIYSCRRRLNSPRSWPSPRVRPRRVDLILPC